MGFIISTVWDRLVMLLCTGMSGHTGSKITYIKTDLFQLSVLVFVWPVDLEKVFWLPNKFAVLW